MKLLSLTVLSSLAATLVAARNCPVESDCIQKACDTFEITDKVQYTGPFESPDTSIPNMLGAVCKDLHGNRVFTYLQLSSCITNNQGNMFFSYAGKYGKVCKDCKILPRKNDEDVIMECKCGDNDKRGTINLSYGIWHYNGRIGCYQEEGGLVPIEPVKKKRSNEPETFSLPWPVGQTLDDVPRSVGQRAVSLPFPVGQTADKIPHPVEHLSDGSTHGPPTLPRDAEMPSERRSEEPSAVKFTRDENTPFGDDDSTEEPAFDGSNGKRSEESHAEYISKRGRSFRQF